MPGLLYAVTPLQALSAAAEREVSFTAFFPDVNVFSATAAGASARAVSFKQPMISSALRHTGSCLPRLSSASLPAKLRV